MRSFVSQLTIHKLEVFCMVAELRSVSRAAERLNIAQPVVSAHLKSLADKLGVSLTKRSGRRIALTEEGQRVYQWAQDVVIRTQELEREIADNQHGLAGKAKIGASMTLGSYVLPGIIAPIRQRYPQGEISVQVTNSILLPDAVRQGECDFAFTILDTRHETAGLEIQRMRDERLILVTSSCNEPKSKCVSLQELAELPFITAQLHTPRRDIEEHLLMEFGILRKQIVMEFGHAEAIKQAVRAGAGVAFLFQSSIRDELASGSLRRLETSGMELRVPFYLVCRKNKNLTKFQTMMLDEISRALRD